MNINKIKIGLVFPNKERRYKTVHLGLGYLAAYARTTHTNLEFQILDTRVATRKETKLFFSTNFDLIGITVFSPVYHEVIDIFKKIKKLDKNIPVCLGGPYVTTIMDEIFHETPAEYGVYGEGEVTFSELISFLKGIKEIEKINGLMYRKNKGNYITNPPREQEKDLEIFPFPAYDLFQMNRYPLHRIVTSRGCPYSCSFCNSSSIWDGRWRKRNPEKVVDEIEFLNKTYGKKIFGFNDNSFNIDLDYVETICNLLIFRKVNIMWSTPVRVERITPYLARKMKQAGCHAVSVGIESANNNILAEINKRATIEELNQGINTFKEAGIEVMGQFVIGNPHETIENIKESIQFAKKSKLDYTNFYTILPYKGTPQWNYVIEEGNLYSKKIHQFHNMKPRIVFDTKEFTYQERLEAIKLVKKEGFYSNQDKKSWMFDFAKEFSRLLQSIFPYSFSIAIYSFLKRIYRLKFIKKGNR
jgi:anaerobic magnesium-protoporphyrin IX monomethyl ester cyclase